MFYTVQGSVVTFIYCTSKCSDVYILYREVYSCLYTVQGSVVTFIYCTGKCTGVYILYREVY